MSSSDESARNPQAKQRFDALLEALLDGAVIIDSSGRIVQINHRTEALFGYGREELLGRPVEVLMPQRFRKRHTTRRQAYMVRPHARPMESGLELWGRHKDGREFPLAISLSPLDSDPGDMTLALIRDISERKAMEARLRESARRFQAIFDQTYQFIGLLSPEGRVLEVNRTALEFGGFQRSAVVGHHFAAAHLWPRTEDRIKLQAALAEAMQGHFARFEAQFFRHDGQVHTVDFSLKPILDDDGEVVLIIPEGRDISARKRMEIALHETQRQLKTVNAQLVHSLQTLQKDEAAGQQLQFQMLPDAQKTFGCYEFSRQLITSTYLSGDFVDYFAIDTGHLGFYIADVSGHGVPSALVTVLLKSHVNRYLELYHQEQDSVILAPEELLGRLNQDLLKARLDKYLTMFYGVLSIADNRLNYANAGQFPFPILFDGEKADFIACKSLPVGLFDGARYPRQTLDLPPRFVLALLSDGVLDLMPQKTLKEKEAALLALMDPGVTIDALIRHLGLDTIHQRPDDVTLLLVHRHGTPEDRYPPPNGTEKL